MEPERSPRTIRASEILESVKRLGKRCSKHEDTKNEGHKWYRLGSLIEKKCKDNKIAMPSQLEYRQPSEITKFMKFIGSNADEIEYIIEKFEEHSTPQRVATAMFKEIKQQAQLIIDVSDVNPKKSEKKKQTQKKKKDR